MHTTTVKGSTHHYFPHSNCGAKSRGTLFLAVPLDLFIGIRSPSRYRLVVREVRDTD